MAPADPISRTSTHWFSLRLFQVPLPTDFKGNGQMVVFSSDSPEDETPESWTPLETEASIINDRIEFSLSSFSM